jgi:hypothetical protein
VIRTSFLLWPVTSCSRYAVKAFCNIRLLTLTPITMPKLRHKMSVLVITAWSSCVLVASTARLVAGKLKPCPMLEGTRKIVASQLGISSHMLDKHVAPMSILTDPVTISHFMRPVAVMMKPADTPQIVNATDGPASRKPDTEAVSSLTA